MGQISRRGDKESDKPMIVGQGVEGQKRQQVSGGVNENCPSAQTFECLVPSWWCHLGPFRR